MLRATNGYEKMSIPDFTDAVQTAVGRMLNVPAYLKLQPIVSDINDNLPTFLERVQKAKQGSKVDRDLRDELRAVLTGQMHQLGFDATALVAGNLALADGTGLQFTKKPTPSAPLVKPMPVILKSGVNPGEILCIATKQQRSNQVMFLITTTPTDDNSWKPISAKRSKRLIKGLVSGQRYYVKYVLTGANDEEAVSDVSSLIAL